MDLMAYEAERARLSDIDEQNALLWFRNVLETRAVTPRHSSLQAILAHYRALQGEKGGMPPRSAMRPAALKAHLPYIFWMEIQTEDLSKPECIRPVDLRFRVFGSQLAEMVGMEMTGRSLADAPFEKSRELAVLGIKVAAEMRDVIRVKGPFLVRDAMPMYLEALLMPFADDQGRPRFLLGEAHDVTH
ncbi:PAS domain-containing protein [Gimibacter soli]|uniref:PAS domain-containing protein n=1 Tax=Gimibacter soli TaxID=3024400 RepID=A0AAE9XRC7_9PROT|nr:PAS domain-containing protein [Gimibacter soli]WCL53500.1 PAS domain-containing protein [Gimibacter soli]